MRLAHFRAEPAPSGQRAQQPRVGALVGQAEQPRVGALVGQAGLLDLGAAISYLRESVKPPEAGWPRADRLRERLGAVRTVDDVVCDPDLLAAVEDIAAYFSLHIDPDHPAFPDRGSVALVSPLARPGNVFVACDRRSLPGAAGEAEARPGPFPAGYLKLPSSIAGPESAVKPASHSSELAVAAYPAAVIGRRASGVEPQDALSCVAGYLMLIDLIAADVHAAEQALMRTSLGVNWPGSAILGPELLVPASGFDPDSAETRLSVDQSAVRTSKPEAGETVRASKPEDSIYSMAELIAHWSLVGLEPLDMVAGGRLIRSPGPSKPTALPVAAGSVIRVDTPGLGAVEIQVSASSTAERERAE